MEAGAETSSSSIAFINEMDRDGASFSRALQSIRTKFGANVVPLQPPILGASKSSLVAGVERDLLV